MTKTAREQLVDTLFHGTGEDYDEQVHLTTLGFDRKWKESLLQMVDQHEPKRILDLACGTGILTFAMADRYPDAIITGVELREEYLVHARKLAEERGLSDRVDFVLSRAETADLGGRTYDTVTSCYIPKYADLGLLVPHLAASVDEGAFVALQDFACPEEGWKRDAWHKHFEKVLKMCRERYPHWITMFEKLPKVIEDSTWIQDLESLLFDNGFEDISVTQHTFGTAATVCATKAPAKAD